jgi:hypothetical protein
MIGDHPIKQILLDTKAYWDYDGTPAHCSRKLLKNHRVRGTIGLGAEIYASETESKAGVPYLQIPILYELWATEAWQADLEAILLDVPYIGITLTIPMEFRTILQQDSSVQQDRTSLLPSRDSICGKSSFSINFKISMRILTIRCLGSDLERSTTRSSAAPAPRRRCLLKCV